MKLTKRLWLVIAAITLFLLWWGVPTFNKWRADKLVDELCAKDGGIKVYETVTLPKERFNRWGQFEVREQRVMKPDDEYYYIWKTADIKGHSGTADINVLLISKSHFSMYRTSDKKLLGEAISYGRRGGDPMGPWMPSSHLCPAHSQNELSKQIFLKADN